MYSNSSNNKQCVEVNRSRYLCTLALTGFSVQRTTLVAAAVCVDFNHSELSLHDCVDVFFVLVRYVAVGEPVGALYTWSSIYRYDVRVYST